MIIVYILISLWFVCIVASVIEHAVSCYNGRESILNRLLNADSPKSLLSQVFYVAFMVMYAVPAVILIILAGESNTLDITREPNLDVGIELDYPYLEKEFRLSKKKADRDEYKKLIGQYLLSHYGAAEINKHKDVVLKWKERKLKEIENSDNADACKDAYNYILDDENVIRFSFILLNGKGKEVKRNTMSFSFDGIHNYYSRLVGSGSSAIYSS